MYKSCTLVEVQKCILHLVEELKKNTPLLAKQFWRDGTTFLNTAEKLTIVETDIISNASELLQKIEKCLLLKEICQRDDGCVPDGWTPDGQRWCTQCLITQPVNQFIFHTEKTFHTHCLSCRGVPCNTKYCKGFTIIPFKRCTQCRDNANRSRKRKRAQIPPIPDGHQHCTQCWNVYPEVQYRSSHVGRKTMTTTCRTCRDTQLRKRDNPHSSINQCQQVYLDWKKDNVCKNCGESNHIEADHLRDKVKNCSQYTFWASNGGTEALKLELAKCQPLCKFCHRLKSAKERGTHTNKDTLVQRHQRIVNAEKLRIGVCQRECGRKVTADTLTAFDWAHKDRCTKTISISHLTQSKKAYFQNQWPIERHKCELLCCMCHKTETDKENANMRVGKETINI